MPAHAGLPIIAVTYSSLELGAFTHWRHMFAGIAAAGGVPLAIDCALPLPHIAEIVAKADGLILSGGGDVNPATFGMPADDPLLIGMNDARDTNELNAWQAAVTGQLPVLAICRGGQLLTHALGGSLYTDIVRDFPKAIRHRYTEEDLLEGKHDVQFARTGKIASWIDGAARLRVNSQHHQGIRELGKACVAVAHSEDGLIEAFEHTGSRTVAVQWHPEVLWASDPAQLSLLRGFVAECVDQPKPIAE